MPTPLKQKAHELFNTAYELVRRAGMAQFFTRRRAIVNGTEGPDLIIDFVAVQGQPEPHLGKSFETLLPIGN